MKHFMKKHTLLFPLLALLVIFGIFGTMSVLQSRYYSFRYYHEKNEKLTDISVKQPDDELLELMNIEEKETETILNLRSVKSGETELIVSFVLTGGAEDIPTEVLSHVHVNKTKMIFIGEKLLDYTGITALYYGIAIFFGLMALYYFWLRHEYQKESYYSFRTISFCSAILFFLVMCLIYVFALLSSMIWDHATRTDILVTLTRNLMLAYSLLTIPFMAVFSIALAISNIDLMRHEGKRPTNMLGIGIALVMTIGTILNFILFSYNYQMGTEYPAIGILYMIYSSGFSIFQLMLTGAIISCLQAAYRKIPYDKDYIIILGCAIRPDGTLYPLLQGRVDRAISFWNAQYKKTGKKAIFVPSGGQGSDEVIAEAEAMERYLLEKGFTKDQILVENRSTTTLENMKFSKKLIGEQADTASLAYSTTSYHVFRSGILADKAGLKIDGIGSKTKWYFWPNAMIREVVGMFAVQTKLQWLVITGIILLAGATGYLYTLIS